MPHVNSTSFNGANYILSGGGGSFFFVRVLALGHFHCNPPSLL